MNSDESPSSSSKYDTQHKMEHITTTYCTKPQAEWS